MALCLASGGVVSHRTAAGVWGLPVTARQAEITIAGSRRVRLRGVTIHHATDLRRVDCVYHGQLPVTSVPRTLIDLAAVLSGEQLELVLDHALAHRQVPLGHLKRRLDALGTRGCEGAGALAGLIAVRLGGSRRPRSTPERKLEKLLAGSGLPPATREHTVRLPDGREVRMDFAFLGAGLGVEVDSYVHHSSLTDWAHDQQRNGELVALGWRILTVTAREIEEDPAAAVDRIARALDAQSGAPAGSAQRGNQSPPITARGPGGGPGPRPGPGRSRPASGRCGRDGS